MEPHMGRAGLASSPSTKASPSTSPASGAGRTSLVESWLLLSLVGKHREGFVQPHQQPRDCWPEHSRMSLAQGVPDTHQVSSMSWTGWPSRERMAAVGGS